LAAYWAVWPPAKEDLFDSLTDTVRVFDADMAAPPFGALADGYLGSGSVDMKSGLQLGVMRCLGGLGAPMANSLCHRHHCRKAHGLAQHLPIEGINLISPSFEPSNTHRHGHNAKQLIINRGGFRRFTPKKG